MQIFEFRAFTGDRLHPVASTIVGHIIDDDENNVEPKPFMLHTGSKQDTITVMMADGSIQVWKNWQNTPSLLVKKVYATGTTVPADVVCYK